MPRRAAALLGAAGRFRTSGTGGGPGGGTPGAQTLGVGGIPRPVAASNVVLATGNAGATLNITTSGTSTVQRIYDGGGFTVPKITIAADYVTVQNYNVSGGGNAGIYSTGTGNTIQNNDISQISEGGEGDINGITFFGNNTQILFNDIDNLVAGDPLGSHTDGIQTWNTTSKRASSNVTIKGNRVNGPVLSDPKYIHQGVTAEGNNATSGGGGGTGNSATWTIDGNYFNTYGNQVLELRDIQGVVVTRNTFAGATTKIVNSGDGSTVSYYSDNIVTGTYGSVGVSVIAGNGPTGPSDSTPPATMIDATGVTFTSASGLAGQYHIYGAGLPGNGAGLVVYLHGDGDTQAETYEYAEPTTNYALAGNRGLIAVAKAKGYVLVVPRAPDTSGAVTWWENASANITYFSGLLDFLVTTYHLDRSKIWLAGYSGGGEFITENYLPAAGAAKITGGGAVILGGGDAASTTPVGWTTAFKSAFPMHWITGLLDDGTFADDGYNALADAQGGSTYYAGQGFTTTLTTPPAWDHDIDGVFGPALDDYLPAMPGYNPPSRTPGTTRPTLITSYLVTGTGETTLTTASFTPSLGEVIVVKGWAASQGVPVFGECTASGGYGLTFAQKAHIPATGKAEAFIWVAEVGTTSPGSMTVQVSWHDGSGAHGAIVERWSGGLVRAAPAQASPVTGSGAPSATITPTNANSVITWLNLDKTAVSGTATYRSSATQTQSTTATIRAYAAYQNATGTSAQTVGLSAPSGQSWTLAAIELLPAP
jgi:hypothetical protein